MAKNKSIRKIALILTTACNMRCKYCFEEGGEYKSEFMSDANIDMSIKRFFDTNYTVGQEGVIELFGGEPLLSYEQVKVVFDSITKYSNGRKDFKIWVTSNIYNIDTRILELLNNCGVLVKLTCSMVFDKESHDIDRVNCAGGGTYDKVINNLMFILKNYKNIYIQVHQVISPKIIRMNKVRAIFDTSLDMIKKYRIKVSTAAVTQGSSSEAIYSDEDIANVVYNVNEHIRDNLEFYVNLHEELASEFVGHWIARNKLAGKRSKIAFCIDMEKQMTIGVDGHTHLCHRMYLGHEMDDGPVSHISDDLFFEKHINKYNDILSRSAAGDITEDTNGDRCFRMYSENGFDCSDCYAGNECHQCYVPLIGEHKNTKTSSECEYTRTLVFIKQRYYASYIRDEYINTNDSILKNLNTMISNEEDEDLLDYLNEIRKQILINSESKKLISI